MIIEEDVLEYLEHFGVKGMRWGVRKSGSDQKTEHSNKKRNAAIVLGSVVAVTAIAAGALYAKKHMGASTKDISKVSETTKNFAESMAKEPVGIVHATRGKARGFTFPQHGGLNHPLREYDKSGLTRDMSDTAFIRYGNRNEKIAARFLDPLGRKDLAGRPIPHEVLLPEEMARGIKSHSDVVSKIWPLIKDTYAPFYRSEAGTFGPGF